MSFVAMSVSDKDSNVTSFSSSGASLQKVASTSVITANVTSQPEPIKSQASLTNLKLCNNETTELKSEESKAECQPTTNLVMLQGECCLILFIRLV